MTYEQYAQYRLTEAAIGGALFFLVLSGFFLFKTITDIRRRNKDWKRALRELQKDENGKDDEA
jgi:preprotein translocase subunit YajC